MVCLISRPVIVMGLVPINGKMVFCVLGKSLNKSSTWIDFASARADAEKYMDMDLSKMVWLVNTETNEVEEL